MKTNATLKTKHTPGPWKTHGGNIIQSENGEDIAKAWMTKAANECANARLIAAAPELLEACQAVLTCNDYAIANDSIAQVTAEFAKILNQVQKAIAKATKIEA